MIKQITINDLNILKNTFINTNYIKEELTNNPFAKVIIYIDKTIKGYLYYSEIYDRIEINQIEVEKNSRNQKIASKLLEELIKKDKDITLEVKQTNEIAIKLYKKYNFKQVAIRKGYYNNIDGLLMERKK